MNTRQRRRTLILIFGLAFGLAACDARSGARPMETVTPGLGMTLGRGYDPTKPLEPKGDCLAGVDAATITSWQAARGIKGDFTETRLQTWGELMRELSLSGTVSAETLWGGGSASLGKYEKFRSDDSSFTWLLNFVVEVGEKTLDGNRLRLSPAAKALADAGRLDDFYRMCGTEYVRSIKLGGKLTLVSEIEAKDTDLVGRLAASVRAHATAGAWGFSGSSSFQEFFHDAYFVSVLKREVQQFGGVAVDVANLTPDRLGATLTEFQGELRADDAVVVEVETASWATLGVRGLDEFADWHRKTTLEALYGQYRRNIELLDRISDYVYWQDHHVHILPESVLAGLNAKKAALDAQQAEIARRGSACLTEEHCEQSGLDLIDVSFPGVGTLGVEEDFGSLSYDVPEGFAAYGSSEVYDGRSVRFYDVPASVHREPGLHQLDLAVYEEACGDAASWLAAQRAKLDAVPGVRVGQVEPVRRSPIGAYQLSWEGDRLSRLIVFKPGPDGICGILKLGLSGTELAWTRLSHLDEALGLIEATLRYRVNGPLP